MMFTTLTDFDFNRGADTPAYRDWLHLDLSQTVEGVLSSAAVDSTMSTSQSMSVSGQVSSSPAAAANGSLHGAFKLMAVMRKLNKWNTS